MWATPILDPGAPSALSLYTIANVPSFSLSNPFGYTFGGIAINGDTLLLSIGDASSFSQTIWSLPLSRVGGHIASVGQPTSYLTVPNGNIYGNNLSGGLVTVTGGVLYTMLPGSVGQAANASSSQTDLALGASGSIGGLQYIPTSQSNAGSLKVSTTSGDWYTLSLSGSPGSYTYTKSAPVHAVQAFSFDYFPGDATFNYPGVVLGDANYISLYALDGNGNPCTVDPCQVVHLVQAVDYGIGYGVARDPVSGDVLFTTGANEIFRLGSTFATPEPSTILLAFAGLALLATVRRR